MANEYRIFHPKTKKYRQFETADAATAIARSGWKAADCEVRVRTPKGGWANIKEDKHGS